MSSRCVANNRTQVGIDDGAGVLRAQRAVNVGGMALVQVIDKRRVNLQVQAFHGWRGSMFFLGLGAHRKNMVDLEWRDKMGARRKRLTSDPSEIDQHAHVSRRNVRQRCPGKNNDQQQPYADKDWADYRLRIRGDNSGIEV